MFSSPQKYVMIAVNEVGIKEIYVRVEDIVRLEKYVDGSGMDKFSVKLKDTSFLISKTVYDTLKYFLYKNYVNT